MYDLLKKSGEWNNRTINNERSEEINGIFPFVSPGIWDELIPGDVLLIVQSGMLSGGFLIHCMSHGIMGISKVCSIGNKMDVDKCEILEYLINDPDTKVVGLYLESINHGRKFMEICQSSSKPIVLLTGGKNAGGAAAALSHTASMAVNTAVASGAMAQAGVIEAMDFNQMMDLCRSLAAYPELHTSGDGRIAVLTYTGGAGIISSDFIDQMNLTITNLSISTREKLKTVFPDWMPISNPIDLWPAVERHGGDVVYKAAVEAVCADPGVDAIFIHAFTGGFFLDFDMAVLADQAKLAGKPVFCWVIGTSDAAKKFKLKALDLKIPVFTELFRAVECMDTVFTRKKNLERVSRTTMETDPFQINETNELQTAMGSKGKILVQQQIQGDLELIAGLMRDPQFGPCVMVGFGGVMTEILNDSVFGVAPLTHTQALELIDRLKTQKLLNGFRGAGAVDRNALAKILVKLGQLGYEIPMIKEIDINPLMICKGKPVAVDALIVLSEQEII